MDLRSRDDVLARLLERDWQRHVMTKAAQHGFHGFHITVSKGTLDGVHHDNVGTYPRRSDHDDAVGIPDLLLVNPERGLLALPELKSARGRVAVAQYRWQGWLEPVRVVTTGIWRPGDEASVDAFLTNGGHR